MLHHESTQRPPLQFLIYRLYSVSIRKLLPGMVFLAGWPVHDIS